MTMSCPVAGQFSSTANVLSGEDRMLIHRTTASNCLARLLIHRVRLLVYKVHLLSYKT